MEVPYQYQVGGSLSPNDPTYVKRSADEELFQALRAGEFCYVLTSRQMGKSSLRLKVMQRLKTQGVVCSGIDVSSIGSAEVTPEEWYAGIIDSIVSSLNLYDSFDLEEWWGRNHLLAPANRLGKFIKDILLTQIEVPIAIFIDEIDSVLSLSFSTDDFFAIIRESYNRRAEDSEYQRLTFALFGVALPSDLSHDRRRTPFNIGTAIELTALQIAEAEPLMIGLEERSDSINQVLEAVLSWTGGQPFLTQKVCSLIQESEIKIPIGKEAVYVKHLVESRIINNWEYQDIPVHLKSIRERLESNRIRNENIYGKLLNTYKDILNNVPISYNNYTDSYSSNNQILYELNLTGLTSTVNGYAKVKNNIYREIFSEDWIDNLLNSFRPYSKKLNFWLNSGKTDTSKLLRGIELKKAGEWITGKSLADIDWEYLHICNTEKHKDETLANELQKENLRLIIEKRRIALFSTIGISSIILFFLLSVSSVIFYKDLKRIEEKVLLDQNEVLRDFEDDYKQYLFNEEDKLWNKKKSLGEVISEKEAKYSGTRKNLVTSLENLQISRNIYDGRTIFLNPATDFIGFHIGINKENKWKYSKHFILYKSIYLTLCDYDDRNAKNDYKLRFKKDLKRQIKKICPSPIPISTDSLLESPIWDIDLFDNYILSGGWSGLVRLSEIDSSSPNHQKFPTKGIITSLSSRNSKTEKIIVVGNQNGCIGIINLVLNKNGFKCNTNFINKPPNQNNNNYNERENIQSGIYSILVKKLDSFNNNRDINIIFSGGWDGTLKFWYMDPNTNKIDEIFDYTNNSKLKKEQKSKITSIKLLKKYNCQYLAFSDQNGYIDILALNNFNKNKENMERFSEKISNSSIQDFIIFSSKEHRNSIILATVNNKGILSFHKVSDINCNNDKPSERIELIESREWIAHSTKITGLLRIKLHGDIYFATSGFDGVVRLWTAEGQLHQEWDLNVPLTNIIFDPNGNVIFTSTIDGKIIKLQIIRKNDLSVISKEILDYYTRKLVHK